MGVSAGRNPALLPPLLRHHVLDKWRGRIHGWGGGRVRPCVCLWVCRELRESTGAQPCTSAPLACTADEQLPGVWELLGFPWSVPPIAASADEHRLVSSHLGPWWGTSVPFPSLFAPNPASIAPSLHQASFLPPTLPPSPPPPTNVPQRRAGMFVPSLAVGAAGGRLVGRFVAWAVHSAGSSLPVSLSGYSVIGEFLQGTWRSNDSLLCLGSPPVWSCCFLQGHGLCADAGGWA
jgi:hypothetical protein